VAVEVFVAVGNGVIVGVLVGVNEGVMVGVLLGIEIGVNVITGSRLMGLFRSSRSWRIHPPSNCSNIPICPGAIHSQKKFSVSFHIRAENPGHTSSSESSGRRSIFLPRM